ncbi:MAG TPA: DMT family transporter [Longimicrobiales bacterium]
MSLQREVAEPVTEEERRTRAGERGRMPGSTPGGAGQARAWQTLTDALPSFPRGLRYMALGAFFFSFMSLLVKLGGRRLPTQEMVLARSATMLLLSWIGLRRAGLSWIGARHRPLLVMRGAFGFAALSCFYFALVRLPLGDANVIQFTNPAFTALFATWVLGERLRLREVGAVVTSLAGVTLIARPSFLFGGVSALDPRVVGIAVLGAICSAAAYVTVRRAEGVHALVIIFYFSLVSVIGSIPAGWSAMVWPTPAEWLLLFAIGATTQIAQLYMTRGFQLERAGRAAAVGYLQVVFAASWGALVLHELPDLATFGGFALVILATLALARSGNPAAAELPLRTGDVPVENAS